MLKNTSTHSPSHCPICGQANQCAMEIEKTTGIAQGPCWCVAQDFSADLLAKVPPSAQHQACICAQCVISAKNTATAA